MNYVLDTNAVAELMKGAPATVARLRAVPKSHVGVPQPVIAEIAFGLARLSRSKRKDRLSATWAALSAELPRIAWTDDVSLAFGQTKATLQRRGTPIEDFDVAIAAHAIAYGATLVTANTRHFERVPGLLLEDWAA